jgi:hypothetical protein
VVVIRRRRTGGRGRFPPGIQVVEHLRERGRQLQFHG